MKTKRAGDAGDVPSGVEIQQRLEGRLRDLTILLCGDETELTIASAQGADQRRHVSISLQTTEAFDGLQDAASSRAAMRPIAEPEDRNAGMVGVVAHLHGSVRAHAVLSRYQMLSGARVSREAFLPYEDATV